MERQQHQMEEQQRMLERQQQQQQQQHQQLLEYLERLQATGPARPAAAPFAADHSHEARLSKENLKQIPHFHGQLSLEGLVEWHRTIDHFAALEQLRDRAIIGVAIRRFAPRVYEWFQDLVRERTDPSIFPPPAYPFTWPELKNYMKKRFTSAFAVESVWRELASLKRGKDVLVFHDQFLKLADLVEGTRMGTERGSRLYMLYAEKMTQSEHMVLEAMAMQAHKNNETLTLHDAMGVVENYQVRNRSMATGCTSSATPAATGLELVPFTSSSHPTATAPMDLSWMETHRVQAMQQRGTRRVRFNGMDRDTCARCGGKGHWSSSCPTPRGWKEGMAIVHRNSGSGGRGRPSDSGPNFNNVEGAKEKEEEEDLGNMSGNEPDSVVASDDEAGND
jgi:hypothetical protein